MIIDSNTTCPVEAKPQCENLTERPVWPRTVQNHFHSSLPSRRIFVFVRRLPVCDGFWRFTAFRYSNWRPRIHLLKGSLGFCDGSHQEEQDGGDLSAYAQPYRPAKFDEPGGL
jgi:hypothetical protein